MIGIALFLGSLLATLVFLFILGCRNNWVFANRNRLRDGYYEYIIGEIMEGKSRNWNDGWKKVPSYNHMLYRVWCWDFDKFITLEELKSE